MLAIKLTHVFWDSQLWFYKYGFQMYFYYWQQIITISNEIFQVIPSLIPTVMDAHSFPDAMHHDKIDFFIFVKLGIITKIGC